MHLNSNQPSHIILKLASAVFFLLKTGMKVPLPLNHENNVYYVQVVIENN